MIGYCVCVYINAEWETELNIWRVSLQKSGAAVLPVWRSTLNFLLLSGRVSEEPSTRYPCHVIEDFAKLILLVDIMIDDDNRLA